jgi:hypothetical protein
MMCDVAHRQVWKRKKERLEKCQIFKDCQGELGCGFHVLANRISLLVLDLYIYFSTWLYWASCFGFFSKFQLALILSRIEIFSHS